MRAREVNGRKMRQYSIGLHLDDSRPWRNGVISSAQHTNARLSPAAIGENTARRPLVAPPTHVGGGANGDQQCRAPA